MANASWYDVVNDAAIPAMEARGLAVALDELVYHIGNGEDLTKDRLNMLHALSRTLRRTCTEISERLDPPAAFFETTTKIDAVQ